MAIIGEEHFLPLKLSLNCPDDNSELCKKLHQLCLQSILGAASVSDKSQSNKLAIESAGISRSANTIHMQLFLETIIH